MTRRWPALVLIPLLILAAVVVDRRDDNGRARRARQDAVSSGARQAELAQFMPVAAPADALSSTWYCAGGTATGDGLAEHVVVVTNPTGRRRQARMTVVPSKGTAVDKAFTVPAYDRVAIALADLVDAPWASAQVDIEGGDVTVEHDVSGPAGLDSAPCASSPSDRWYFASGATTRDADEHIVLFNPFPDPATIDMSFATADGKRVPAAFNGLQVAGRSVLAVRITPVVTVRDQLSAVVVARAGQVVADRVQVYDGRGASTTEEEAAAEEYRPKGLTIGLGVPRPASTWAFPFGIKSEGAHERVVVFNPSARDAEVELAITFEDPQRNGEIDPLQVTVPAGSFQVVDLDEYDQVAARVPHTTVVHATNGVSVVAEQTIVLASPSRTIDTAATPGSPLAAPAWVLGSGANITDQVQERVVLFNPTSRTVTVDLVGVADGRRRPLGSGGRVRLGPLGHRVVPLEGLIQARRVSVLVKADGPVVAERVLLRPKGRGYSTAVGVPLPTGLVLVPASAAG